MKIFPSEIDPGYFPNTRPWWAYKYSLILSCTKSVLLGVFEHTFDLRTKKAETVRSLSLRSRTQGNLKFKVNLGNLVKPSFISECGRYGDIVQWERAYPVT